MSILRLVAGTMAVLVAGGCGGRDALAPSAPPSAAQRSPSALATTGSGQVQTSGLFDANVDFSTLSLTPRGGNCLLVVKGQLVFHGAIQGAGNGQTTALVFGSCAEVASTPPGTDADVFTSELEFTGTIAGEPAHAHVMYQGRVQPGGHIDGRLIFSNGVSGELEASAQVAVGGEYHGAVVVH
ncbi:MAG: hypothetical protein HOQ11_07045 [Gemmatimonadaceae bacterium]|nr:hypothetical protein [Gemmatimonadaceae bacterium]NUQ92943.1 hypothetical protein [Gemmatimonadaceae bacterium]NUR20328.1 hypothetical protein [Gemmatimonadaceae bacterium]NUS97147.1 hypothetical protein [Gemmatimonadaceae bacterium]